MDRTVIGISRGDNIRGRIKVNPEDKSEDLEGRWSVVRSKQGEELVKISCVAKCSKSCEEKKELGELKRVLSSQDIGEIKEIRDFEERAEKVWLELIKKHNLSMKIIKTMLSFDRQRLKFYFTAEERVDFRGLVRDLVARFHKLIRLQQIGPRDHARIAGGAGVCGRELCCASFLDEVGKITKNTTAFARMESQSSEKISGVCGKLMCCLRYEEKVKDQRPKVKS